MVGEFYVGPVEILKGLLMFLIISKQIRELIMGFGNCPAGRQKC